MLTRHGVPPIATRHLQEAIVSSTLMYGSEVTWRVQGKMETTPQKSINRMARASPFNTSRLSTGGGGSMPATARLDTRQGAFATRLASVQDGPHRE